VANNKHDVWDELVELGRRILNKLDDLLIPEKPRKPARVPVPVRNNPHQVPPNPYEQD